MLYLLHIHLSRHLNISVQTLFHFLQIRFVIFMNLECLVYINMCIEKYEIEK